MTTDEILFHIESMKRKAITEGKNLDSFVLIISNDYWNTLEKHFELFTALSYTEEYPRIGGLPVILVTGTEGFVELRQLPEELIGAFDERR